MYRLGTGVLAQSKCTANPRFCNRDENQQLVHWQQITATGLEIDGTQTLASQLQSHSCQTKQSHPYLKIKG